MKLSKLLTDKVTIDEWDLTLIINAYNKQLDMIKNNIDSIDQPALLERLMSVEDAIQDNMRSMLSTQCEIAAIQEQAAELVHEMALAPLVESYEHYKVRMNWFDQGQAHSIRTNEIFKHSVEQSAKFNALVVQLASWKYPSAYIRPNRLRFLNALKASDILYVLEHCDVTDYLKDNLSESEYKMIRFKIIAENKEQFITNSLPLNQLGLIVMEDFINYKPMEIIKQYLNEAMEVLRPGGSMLFTFNDCDYPSGAVNFEQGQYSFTPGSTVRELCEMVGFEVSYYDQSDRVSWICIKKPGELTSLKGGKTLGEIHLKT